MAAAAGSVVFAVLTARDLGLSKILRTVRPLQETSSSSVDHSSLRSPRAFTRTVSSSAHSTASTSWITAQPPSPSSVCSTGASLLKEPFPIVTDDVASYQAAAEEALALAKEAARVARQAAAFAEAADLSLLDHLHETSSLDSWNISSFLQAGGLLSEGQEVSPAGWHPLLAVAPTANDQIQEYISDKQLLSSTFGVTSSLPKAKTLQEQNPHRQEGLVKLETHPPKRVFVASGKKGKRGPGERRSTKAGAAAAATAAEGSESRFRKAMLLGVPGSLRDFMDTTTGANGLLTAQEEIELTIHAQKMMKLEEKEAALYQRLGRKPTRDDLAREVGLSTRELDNLFHQGRVSKHRMISCNMGLVIAIARKYPTWGLSLDEILTKGCCGLNKAIEKFDHSRGFKFSTYAHWWVRQSIGRCVTEQSRTVRIPPHIYELLARVTKARDMLVRELGRNPGDEEVAELVGMSADRLRKVLKSAKPMLSMDKPTSNDSEMTWGSFVASPEDDSFEVNIERELLNKDLENALHTLLPREREVLRQRFGLVDGRPRTLEEVGVLFRVTRERIRQLEQRAIRKLREADRSIVLKEYVE